MFPDDLNLPLGNLIGCGQQLFDVGLSSLESRDTVDRIHAELDDQGLRRF